MLNRKAPEKSGLDLAIDQILDEMQGYTCDEDEYDKMTDQLKKLYKLKAINAPERVSKDTLALIAGNLLVALVIVAYEQKAVVTTKATNFLLKTR
jgi:hypothetical protein